MGNANTRQDSNDQTLFGAATNKALYQSVDRIGQHIAIYKATKDDLPAIVAIYNQNIKSRQATADLTPINIADREAWLDASIQNPNRPIYVLKMVEEENVANEDYTDSPKEDIKPKQQNPTRKQERIVAWGSFSDYKARSAYHISSEISVYVDNRYQRRGLARLLLTWMLEQAPSLGIKQVMALIFAHNTASISLFKKLDFDIWGTLPKVCDMDGFYADVVIMGVSSIDQTLGNELMDTDTKAETEEKTETVK